MLRPGTALLVLAALPAVAVAQSKSALSWVREPGAESCIGTVELGQRVERLVGPMLVAAPEGQVSVEGRIRRAGRRFAAEITVADAEGNLLGKRKLESESDDCRALDDKLAFVIAVAIDPNAALAELPGELSQEEDPGGALLAELRAQPGEPASTSTSTKTSTSTSTSEKVAGRPDTPADPVQLRVTLEPALGLGNLPSPGAGALLGAGVAFGEVALWLRAAGWLPQTEVVRGQAGVQVMTFGLSLAVCPIGIRSAPWGLYACAGAGVDLLLGRPVDFDGSTQKIWVFGPDLELRAGLEVGADWWFGLSGVLSSRWPQRDLGYRTGGADRTVFGTAVVSGRLAGVAELRF